MVPRRLKDGPLRCQGIAGSPKAAEVDGKKLANMLETAPTRPQEGPRRPQDGPKGFQDGPKMASRGLEMSSK